MGTDLPKKPKIEPRVEMTPLHWKKIRPICVEKTMWKDLDDEHIELDLDSLEELFQKKKTTKKKGKSKKEKPGDHK